MSTLTELPRDYMARCAQSGRKGAFEYLDRLIGPGEEHLRFIGGLFASETAARRWDDRPGNLVAWWGFPTWEACEVWLYGDADEPTEPLYCEDGNGEPLIVEVFE